MIVFEVIGISGGRLHFDFEKKFYLIRRLFETLVEVGNDNISYVTMSNKQVAVRKSPLTKLVA